MANIADVKTYWKIDNVPQKWYSRKQTRNIFNKFFTIEIQGEKRGKAFEYKFYSAYAFLISDLNLFRRSNPDSHSGQNWLI